MIVLAFAEAVQIAPDFGLVVNVILILAMIWVLNRTFFKPINRVISARSKNKGGQFSESETILNAAAAKEQSFKDGLLAARTEGYELIESERTDAMNLKHANVGAAKTEVAAKTESDLTELGRKTEEAREIISAEADKLANEISSNILKTA